MAIFNEARSRILNREEGLSHWAIKERTARGRARPEKPDFYRGAFQRDRDRIIHTNSFRRLKHKSQVLVAPQGDHFTTRLTHVMEVSQIGRTITRALNLNEDLVEAAALGHDLGHTPFGHIGETVFNRLIPEGFHHSSYGVTLVTQLEKNGRGLNLMHDTVEAIRLHSKPQGSFLTANQVAGMSLEAQIVRISDALAYLTHDMNDAMRAGVMSSKEFPTEALETLGESHSSRINALVSDVIINSAASLSEHHSPPISQPWIQMSSKMTQVVLDLRNFMFEHFYIPTSNGKIGKRAAEIVERLFVFYSNNPTEIPMETRQLTNDPSIMALHYVCGMTDNFALLNAERLWPKISREMFQGKV